MGGGVVFLVHPVARAGRGGTNAVAVGAADGGQADPINGPIRAQQRLL